MPKDNLFQNKMFNFTEQELNDVKEFFGKKSKDFKKHLGTKFYGMCDSHDILNGINEKDTSFYMKRVFHNATILYKFLNGKERNNYIFMLAYLMTHESHAPSEADIFDNEFILNVSDWIMPLDKNIFPKEINERELDKALRVNDKELQRIKKLYKRTVNKKSDRKYFTMKIVK